MSKKYEKLTKSAIAIAILFFVARCFISTPSSMYDFCGCIGESTTVSLFLVLLYNHCLWKINPISSIPKIYGSFKGTIEYKYNDEVGIKEVDVSIKQTFLNTKVYLESDEMKSAAIMCDIVEENGLVYLYYTYITNPKAKYSEKIL